MENAVPTQSKLKGFLRRPAVMIGLGACAVASTFVFLTVSGQGPKVSHSTIPIPFIPGENHGAAAAGNGLAGSVTYVRTLANGVEFYEMDFVGDSSQLAPADKVYLVKVPTGVTSIPFERVVLDSNGATRPYYGYIYTSSSAATEIANQTATGFAVRFPGLFFASAAVKAAHGTDLDAFASINGIVFKTSTQFDTGSGARLRGPQLIALVPTDQNLLIDIAPVCGNSWKAATEDCDDGNVDNGDGCSSTCTIESGFTCDATSEQSVCTPAPVCGDGFKTQGETCDDGNTDAGDGCSATCAAEAGFTCDASEPSLCIRTCGNGVRGAGETCDDGNIDSGDGCSATCAVENGFTCDTASPNVCDSTASAVCGNSEREGDTCGNAYVDNNEECDYAIECEGVPDGGTCACHADCTICDGNESCVYTAPAYNGETCDDGNTDAADGCDATCDVESGFTCDTASPNVCTALPANTCGDGNLEAGETCDDGDTDGGDGCSAVCAVESGFTCDGDSPTICTPDPVCGDGTKDNGEACDDGNTSAADGCSATCTVESGYVCDTGTPNICTKTCGDGTRGQGETCDDGNEDAGDGCSATCTVENGYTCNTDTPNVCDPNGANAVCGNSVREGDLCGNQFVDNDEECDYAVDCAGVADGQTCTCHADCTICDGNEDCTFTAPAYNGETCDDGDTDAGDGCNATCDVETDYSCDTATPNVCSFDGNMCTYQSIGTMTLSDDGRYTAYLTAGSGAITDFQVVLYDRVADTSVAVTNINAAPQDGVPNWADAGPYISGDGRYLAFDGIVTGVSKKLTIYDRVNDTYAVLATSGSFMQLSDDGNALVYQYQGCIIAYDKTSGNYTNVAGPNADCLSGVTPVTNNGDPIVTTTEIPYEGVISGNGRYVFFLVPNTGVPEIGGGPQKDVYRVDLTNNATVIAATAQVGSHLSVTADGNVVFYSFTLTGEYDEATYNFTTQTSSEFDMEGVLAGGLDTNIDQISSDGTIYQIFGGVGPNGVRQAVYSATTQQVIYEVPDVLNAFIFLSGDGNNLAYVSDTPGGPTGHWSVFVRNIVQESTKITPSEYQCQ